MCLSLCLYEPDVHAAKCIGVNALHSEPVIGCHCVSVLLPADLMLLFLLVHTDI